MAWIFSSVLLLALIGYLFRNRRYIAVISTPRFSVTPQTCEVRLPLRVDERGLYLVTAALNDCITAEFIVDTGSSGTAISIDTAKRLGMKKGAQVSIMGSENSAKVNTVSIDKLTLGDLTCEKINVFILPDMNVLGGNVLHAFCPEFRVTKGLLVLYPSCKSDPCDRDTSHEYGQTIRIRTQTRFHKPHVPVCLNGVQFDSFLIDTGCNVTTVSKELALSLALPSANNYEMHTMDAFGQIQTRSAVRIDSLEIGGCHLDEQIAGVSSLPKSWLGLKSQGLLGTKALGGNFDFQIDYKKKYLILRKPSMSTGVVNPGAE